MHGPTFSCPSMSGSPAALNPLPLVCSLQQLCTQERCIHRRNDRPLRYRHSELACITSHQITPQYTTPHHTTPHHTTSHHITPSQITSHHITYTTSDHITHHITILCRFYCIVCTLHFVFTLESKRHIFTVKLNDTREPRSANMAACLPAYVIICLIFQRNYNVI